MEITYIGHSSFKLRGKSGTLVSDPFNPASLGSKFPKVEADVVTISHGHDDHNYSGGVSGSPLIIAGPGEYEVKGIKIIGVPSFHDNENGKERGENTIYRIEIDGISVVHLGDLGHKLDDKSLEILDGVDILLIPVGGVYTISAPIAAEVISQLEPKIVLPMHYNTKLHNQKIFSNLSGVDVFLKEMGKEDTKPIPKLSVTKDRLPTELTVVVLE
ncbi:MBL fold metallo-hydrolase [Candidatus Gottesmanbacteria bacterium]|nr:MBL fold metallo-hydrolase [Candidatus Gottesmanbacteria bacterium]MBI5451853.1 MBL fold metallo-hydrolase [Candidatus Gottesmanbacteria bacterium]